MSPLRNIATVHLVVVAVKIGVTHQRRHAGLPAGGDQKEVLSNRA